jgi:hypothetical protein
MVWSAIKHLFKNFKREATGFTFRKSTTMTGNCKLESQQPEASSLKPKAKKKARASIELSRLNS